MYNSSILFGMSSSSSAEHLMRKSIEHGVIGPLISQDKGEQTKFSILADFLGIKSGDYLFFFQGKMIYGIGRVKDIIPGQHCMLNYPQALDMKFFPKTNDNMILQDQYWYPELTRTKKPTCIPWLIAFEPAPKFFRKGISMTELLSKDSHNLIRQIRFFSGRTFTRLGVMETEWLMKEFSKLSLDSLNEDSWDMKNTGIHERMAEILINNSQYSMDTSMISLNITNNLIRGKARSEALKAMVVKYLVERDSSDSVLGKNDLVYVEYVVDSYKPPEYVNKENILGVQFHQLNPNFPFTPVRWNVIHVHPGNVIPSTKDGRKILSRLMKNVDWIAKSLANSNYSSVGAYLVCKDFIIRGNGMNYYIDITKRMFSRKIIKNEDWIKQKLFEWNRFQVVKYGYSDDGFFLEPAKIQQTL